MEADLVVLGTGIDAENKLKTPCPGPFADVLENSAGIIPYSACNSFIQVWLLLLFVLFSIFSLC